MFISYAGWQRKRNVRTFSYELACFSAKHGRRKLAEEARCKLYIVQRDALIGRMYQRNGVESRHGALRKEPVCDALGKRFPEPVTVRKARQHERQQIRIFVHATHEFPQESGKVGVGR